MNHHYPRLVPLESPTRAITPTTTTTTTPTPTTDEPVKATSSGGNGGPGVATPRTRPAVHPRPLSHRPTNRRTSSRSNLYSMATSSSSSGSRISWTPSSHDDDEHDEDENEEDSNLPFHSPPQRVNNKKKSQQQQQQQSPPPCNLDGSMNSSFSNDPLSSSDRSPRKSSRVSELRRGMNQSRASMDGTTTGSSAGTSSTRDFLDRSARDTASTTTTTATTTSPHRGIERSMSPRLRVGSKARKRSSTPSILPRQSQTTTTDPTTPPPKQQLGIDASSGTTTTGTPSSTLWRRNPVQATRKSFTTSTNYGTTTTTSSQGLLSDAPPPPPLPGQEDPTKFLQRSPPTKPALKRGGSMRNLLRTQRRLEKELHKAGVLHPPGLSKSKSLSKLQQHQQQHQQQQPTPTPVDQKGEAFAPSPPGLLVDTPPDSPTERRRLNRVLEPKHHSEPHGAEAGIRPRPAAVVDEPKQRPLCHNSSDDDSIFSDTSTDDETMVSASDPAPGIRRRAGLPQLLLLPEPKQSQCLSITMDDWKDMDHESSVEGGMIQVQGLAIEDGSGSSGTYAGSVIQSSNMPHGQGTLQYHDGCTFDGTFVLGAKLYGTMRYSDGSTYQGQFSDGLRQGHGRYTFPNRVFYRGEFDNDTMQGVGTLTWPNGRRYVGYWKKGIRHGPGKYFLMDGTLYREGVWKDGSLIEL